MVWVSNYRLHDKREWIKNRFFLTLRSISCQINNLRSTLKNLSRCSNMVGSTRNEFNVSRFKPALQWIRFLVDLRRGSNSIKTDYCSLLVSKMYRLKMKSCLVYYLTINTHSKANPAVYPRLVLNLAKINCTFDWNLIGFQS